MRQPQSLTVAALLALGLLATAAPGASAAEGRGGGGLAAAPVPAVLSLECLSRCEAPTARLTPASAGEVHVVAGAIVRVVGTNLRRAKQVVFLGGAGPADDRRVRVRRASARALKVRVPTGTATGALQVVDRIGQSSAPSAAVVGVEAPAPAAADAESAIALPAELATPHTFPIAGKHDYGGSGAGFGSGRSGHSHQGHDVFGACGTPLVATRAGAIKKVAFHGAAGHYLVLDGDDSGFDYVYMHMQEAATLKPGDRVTAGQPVGLLGDSGNARGCHLHFELWSAPGYYTGGSPIDPLPALKAWDSATP